MPKPESQLPESPEQEHEQSMLSRGAWTSYLTPKDRFWIMFVAMLLGALIAAGVVAPGHLADVAFMIGCLFGLPLSLFIAATLKRHRLRVTLPTFGLVVLGWLASTSVWDAMINPLLLTLLLVLCTAIIYIFVPFAPVPNQDACLTCGYCTKGLPEPRCPECGSRL